MRVACLLLLAVLTATTGLAAQEQERVVRELAFVGNKALDDLTLESAIATTKSSWWARSPLVRWLGLGEKRYFNEVEFRRDVVRLILLYRQSGYMNAVVDTVVQRTARDAYVEFRIHEGEPVRVTRLEVVGTQGIFNIDKLKRDLPLQVGDPFNRFLMQASADTIVQRLRDNGFPYAEVLRNFDSDAGERRAEVELDAQPGQHMRVGEVVIRGLRDVDTGTVRRVMSVRPGDRFNQSMLYQTQRDLYGMGVFNSVNVVLIDSISPQTVVPGDSSVRVLIQVQEGPRHQTRIGFGYATVECFRLQTGWTAHDFFGGARSLDLSARFTKLGGGFPAVTNVDQTTGIRSVCNPFAGNWTVDTMNYQLNANLRKPAFLSRTNLATVGLTAERSSQFGVYTREAVGGDATITFNTRGRLPITLGYYYAIGRTTASDAFYCSIFRVCDEASRHFLRDRRQFGALSVSLTRDRVNNVLDPSRGSLTTLTLLNASHLFGSQVPYEFNRGEFEAAKYYSIGRRTVFAWRVHAGVILPRNIGLNGQQVAYVPPDQRFYGGGPTSVRGYGLNEMGPRVYYVSDTTKIDSALSVAAGEKVWQGVITAPTGGNTLIVLNAELRLPSPILPQRMRLGLFVDAGQVWERGAEAFPISGLRVTPGAGLRFATPLGPVRVDAAYNGYPVERGPLLYVPPAPPIGQPAEPVLQLRESYPPLNAQKTFWQKVVVQFAIGHAF
ncbi:MAG TPA: BamA/TamA family outer membrane protein [Gemmatimonadales bacterium]|nr:BamA/TamA family outer membrane protein [Gemmatimonadales bacterium]